MYNKSVVYKKGNKRGINYSKDKNDGIFVLEQRKFIFWKPIVQYTYKTGRERQGYNLAMYNELYKSK